MRVLGTCLLLVCIFLFGGCAKAPFTRPPLPQLHHPDPTAIRQHWAEKQPDVFVTENSFVIHIPFRDDLSFLGIVQVDRPAETFEFVALTQTGVQLFHVHGDRSGNHIRDAIAPLMQRRNILLSFAEDIRRIYLDLTPDADARPKVKSKIIRFTDTNRGEKVRYEFGGEPIVLLEKRFPGFLRTKWRAEYFDYAHSGDALYPRGVLVKNGRNFYRITIRNRNFQVVGADEAESGH